MTSIEIRKNIYASMESHLEDACAYLAINNKQLFHYYSGKADACRTLLEELFGFDERYATEHIKNMWEITDENW